MGGGGGGGAESFSTQVFATPITFSGHLYPLSVHYSTKTKV